MTIKARNRINIVFSIIAIAVTALQIILMLYQLIFNKLEIPQVYLQKKSSVFLFEYKPIFVIIGVVLLDFYVIAASIFLHNMFEKTQSAEVIFFLMFLAACLCDSTRILVPIFKVANTFSRFLMQLAYVTLFARILAPLSLLGSTVLTDDDARQNVDRNCIFIIITALFFAKLIPFNTAVVYPNFCISYGNTTTLRYSSFFICLASMSALIINNKKNEYGQKTTIGFALLAVGYSAIFYCYNLFNLLFGSLCLIGGTYIYLISLHRQYLWLD